MIVETILKNCTTPVAMVQSASTVANTLGVLIPMMKHILIAGTVCTFRCTSEDGRSKFTLLCGLQLLWILVLQ